MTLRAVLFPLLSLLLLSTTTRAAEPPVRVLSLAATADGPSAYVGEAVQFTDSSTGTPTSWSWDFSYDGAQALVDSIEQHPVWTFDTAGTYAIRLEVCNTGGCGAAVKEILVAELCTATHDLVLPSQTVSDTQQFDACQTISATSGFSVVAPGSVTFRAGRSIALGSGFSIGTGTSFRAVIDPTLDTP